MRMYNIRAYKSWKILRDRLGWDGKFLNEGVIFFKKIIEIFQKMEDRLFSFPINFEEEK